MSYGRSPHYIYSDGKVVHFPSGSIPVEELSQFVARMVARGTELRHWVDQGVALTPEQFSSDFGVTVHGGWHNNEGRTVHPDGEIEGESPVDVAWRAVGLITEPREGDEVPWEDNENGIED